MRKPILQYVIAIAILILMPPQSAPKASPSDPAPHDAGNGLELPWHIAADRIQFDADHNRYTAEGNVLIHNEEYRLSADRIRFDSTSNRVSATGDAMLRYDSETITGSLMEFDLSAKTGSITDARFVSEDSAFHISGALIEKTGDRTFTGQSISMSACEGDCPAWKITGKRLGLRVDGYGKVSNGVFWIKNIPVLYMPMMTFPIKISRQSGFLSPRTSLSERQGFAYDQPVFWAINAHSDATLYLHHMSKRGTKVGMEYRYAGIAPSRATVMIDGFTDRQVDDGRPGRTDQDQWAYEEDSVLRPNPDRYWFRMKWDQVLPGALDGKLDLDLVSDQDYLREFRSGTSGYDRSDATYHEVFTRSLDRYDDPVRVNRINLHKSWDSYSINGGIRWYDDVIKRRQGDRDSTVQKLPLFVFNALKQRAFATPAYCDVTADYTYYFRSKGAKGHQFGAGTRLYLPYRLFGRIMAEPSLGVHQTMWHGLSSDEAPDNMDDAEYRTAYDFRLELAGTLYRIFSPENSALPASGSFKHLIRPKIVYAYQPAFSQDNFPLFSPEDRIGRDHRLGYGMTNVLIKRSGSPAEAAPEGLSRSHRPTYRSLLRIDLEQSYNLGEEKLQEGTRFSPVYGRLEFQPTPNAVFNSEAGWSVAESRFIEGDVSLTVSDSRNDAVSVEYHYTDGIAESMMADAVVQLTGEWLISGDLERNLIEGRTIRESIGLSYHGQCWFFEIRYAKEERDNRFELSVSLLGIDDITYPNRMAKRMQE